MGDASEFFVLLAPFVSYSLGALIKEFHTCHRYLDVTPRRRERRTLAQLSAKYSSRDSRSRVVICGSQAGAGRGPQLTRYCLAKARHVRNTNDTATLKLTAEGESYLGCSADKTFLLYTRSMPSSVPFLFSSFRHTDRVEESLLEHRTKG